MLSKTRNAMRLRDRLITVLFLVPDDCIRSRWGTRSIPRAGGGLKQLEELCSVLSCAAFFTLVMVNSELEPKCTDTSELIRPA